MDFLRENYPINSMKIVTERSIQDKSGSGAVHALMPCIARRKIIHLLLRFHKTFQQNTHHILDMKTSL